MPTSLTRQRVTPVALIIAAAGLWMLARGAGALDGGFSASWRGALAARGDVAPALIIATVAWALHRDSLRAGSAAQPATRSWSNTARLVAALVALWWFTLLVIQAALGRSLSLRALALDALTLRDWGDVDPGLGSAWLIGALAMLIALEPVCSTIVRRWGRRSWLLEVALIGVAIGSRAGATAVGAVAHPTDLLTWLPAHLDAVAAGFVAARWMASPHRPTRAWLRPVAGLVAAASIAVASVDGVIGRSVVVGDGWGVQARGALAAVIALALLVAVFAGRDATTPDRPWLRRLGAVVALAAPGIVVFHDAALIGLARQHRERITDLDGVVSFEGVVAPLATWALLVAGSAGVLISVTAIVIVRRRLWRELPWTLALGAVVAAGALVRVAALIHVAPEKTDLGDPLYYHTTANLLASGRGYLEPLKWIAFGEQHPSAFHGPLYPTVLSVSSRLGGTTYVDHKMASIVIGAALVALIGVLGRQVGGRAVGVTAAALAAVHPNLWQIDSLLYPEGLMALLVTATVILTYRWRDRPTWAASSALGGLTALAALTRGEALLLAPLLITPWMMRASALPWRRRMLHLAVAGATCVAVLAPWAIRNALRFEEFVPLSTNGNEVLVYANCATAYDGPLVGYWDYQCQQRIRDADGEPPGDESQTARHWRDIGVDYARAHAAELPRVVSLRVLRQWELFRPVQNVRLATIEGRNLDAGAAGLALYYGLVIAGVPGAIVLRRRGARLWPLLAPLAMVTLTAAATYASIRFRAPAEPMLCVLGAAGIVTGSRRVRAWHARQVSARPEPADEDPAAFVLGGRCGLRLRAAGHWSRAGVATWSALTIVAVAIALPLRGLYHTTGGTMEEGFMLVFPERMLRGDLPNEDFLHLYGPGALHTLMGWYEVFGVSLAAERTFGLLQHLAIIAALFTLARPWGRVAAVAVATVSVLYVLTPIGLTAMAWNGAVALGLWSVVAALRARHLADARRSRRWLFVAGVLAGLSLTYRPDLGVAIALVAVWSLWRRPHRRVAIAGAVIGLTPMWVHVALVGPRLALRGMFTDPVVHLRAGRALPRPPSLDRLDGSLQAIAELAPPWWGVPSLSASMSLFVWFFVMLGACAALLWTARRLDPGRGGGRRLVLGAVALFALGLLPQALQRPDSTHLAWVTCVSIPFVVIVVIELLRRRARGWSSQGASRSAAALGVVAALTLTATVAPLFTLRSYLLHTRVSVGDVQRPFLVERNGRQFYLGAWEPYLATTAMIDDLDRRARPGERLLVGPSDLRRTWYSDAFFYYLFPELPPATSFIEMDPGLANAPGSRLAEDVRSADWIILTGFWDGWFEPNASMDFGSDLPNQIIRDEFCVAGRYQNGLIVLYHRCEAR